MITTAALLPIAATAAQYLVRGVGNALQEGASFAEMLLPKESTWPADEGTTAAADANDMPALTNDSRLIRWKTAWQNFNTQIDSVRQLFVEKLAGSDIDLEEPVVLRSDAAGHLVVANDHPNRGEIEQLLESDSGLAGQLRQLFAQLNSLESPSETQDTPNSADVRLVINTEKAFFAYQ